MSARTHCSAATVASTKKGFQNVTHCTTKIGRNGGVKLMRKAVKQMSWAMGVFEFMMLGRRSYYQLPAPAAS
jgi:hypothetical protein